MSKRDELFKELRDVIESIDAGKISITIYKGMPVKFEFVTQQEIVLGGGAVEKIDDIEVFVKRRWWTQKNLTSNKNVE